MLNFKYISIKSKIGVEFRRYVLSEKDIGNFDDFYKKIEFFHHLSAIPFVIFYLDPEDCLLPINNNVNLARAISSAKHITLYDTNSTGSRRDKDFITNNNYYYNNQPTIIRRPFLKIFIEKKGTFLNDYNGNLTGKSKKGQHSKGFSNFMMSSNEQSPRPSIGVPEDFRKVSSIIDVNEVPAAYRRVRINKHGSDKPLGFYIRDGAYLRKSPDGHVATHYGIFISRVVPGGLADSTNLLAENDEILEVNGIEVGKGKRLDQVRDMMIANSSNLIITTRPARYFN